MELPVTCRQIVQRIRRRHDLQTHKFYDVTEYAYHLSNVPRNATPQDCAARDYLGNDFIVVSLRGDLFALGDTKTLTL